MSVITNCSRAGWYYTITGHCFVVRRCGYILGVVLRLIFITTRGRIDGFHGDGIALDVRLLVVMLHLVLLVFSLLFIILVFVQRTQTHFLSRRLKTLGHWHPTHLHIDGVHLDK